jgi:hypothetical protein
MFHACARPFCAGNRSSPEPGNAGGLHHRVLPPWAPALAAYQTLPRCPRLRANTTLHPAGALLKKGTDVRSWRASFAAYGVHACAGSEILWRLPTRPPALCSCQAARAGTASALPPRATPTRTPSHVPPTPPPVSFICAAGCGPLLMTILREPSFLF